MHRNAWHAFANSIPLADPPFRDEEVQPDDIGVSTSNTTTYVRRRRRRYRHVFCTECGGRDEFDCLCFEDEDDENEGYDPFAEPLVCDFCEADSIYECTCEPCEEITAAIYLPKTWWLVPDEPQETL